MAEADADTFTGLMQWLRARGKSALALPLRRRGLGSLSALMAADEAVLRDAECPEDLVDMLLAMRRPSGAPPAVSSAAAKPDDGGVTFEVDSTVVLVDLKGAAELNGRTGSVKGFESTKQRWIVDLGPELGRKLFRGVNLQPAQGSKAAAPVAAATNGGDTGGRGAPERPAATPPPAAAFRMPWASAKASGRPSPAGRDPIESVAEKVADVDGLLAPDAVLDRTSPPPGPALDHQGALRPGAQVTVEVEREPRCGEVGVCEMFDFASGLWRLRFADGGEANAPAAGLLERKPGLRPGAHVRIHGLSGINELNGSFGVCDATDVASGRWSVLLESGDWKLLDAKYLKPQDGSAKRSREAELAAFENPRESRFLGAMEDALESGDISWLDC